MSEIAKGTHSDNLVQRKPTISEHAQEYATGFSPAILDNSENTNLFIFLTFSN